VIADHAIPGLSEEEPRAPDAGERLARLRRRFPEAVEDLAALCRRAPDPDLALAGLERYADAAGGVPGEPDLRQALTLLCGASRHVAGLLARTPTLLRRAARSPDLLRPRTEERMRRVLARAAAGLGPDDVAGLHRLLRRFRDREVVRIVLRDLRRARMAEVMDELASLATSCIDAAIRFHDRRLRQRHGAPAGLSAREPGAGFCVLAMGKLGARELNFSSDVDLVYVYLADGQTEGENGLTHFAYYARLAELVTESIAKATEDGSVFRVDLNLRPDGRSGPIVNSVRAAELYYQSFGRSWERNALLKARPCAGDLQVGDDLLRLLEPFVWRRSLDTGVLEEIQAMKARIDARAGAEGRDDLKLGRGGIREGEFFVSALQLLHGGRAPELRQRAMLQALDRLLYAGVVPARDRDALADTYLFLRRAEHRVQMMDARQTHRLPPPGERRWLARAMGFSDEERFEAVLAAHRDRVAGLFGGLLGTGTGEWALDPELALLADAQVEDDARRAAIATRRGFGDPDRTLAAIDVLARRRTPFSPTGDPVQAVALLAEVLATPDPDQALSHLADFAAALQSPEPYFRMLRQHRRAARLLLSLFGTSDFLSKRFLRHPELIDALLRDDQATQVKGPELLGAELDERLALVPADLHPDDALERKLAEMRRFKNEEVLRIAVHDIAGALPLASVADQLTDLAEALLQRALTVAEEEAAAKGRQPPSRLCLVAMGKLGGRELGYHSDLDLIFLYRSHGPPGGPSPPSGQAGPPAPGLASAAGDPRFARLAQRVLSFLQVPLREGVLYKCDTRLRPSGNQGALVSSTEGFARYHLGGGDSPQVQSQLWERQALLRARCVAGDRELFEEVRRAVLTPVLFGITPDRPAMAAEIRRMRERMEAELGREAARGLNPKTGRGGLVDVEFAAQYLQLAFGHEQPSIRSPNTPTALARSREAGLLRDGQFQALSRGYDFLRRLELRLRIVHDYSIDHLPPPGRVLDQLARRLGYYGTEPAARLLADYGRVTEQVRAAYQEVVR
jgi:[glutamine synthetase] adenylyltransferase / [glutamine synthetase]-adenylyl-L-tyrosine phosphorylase